VGVQVVHVGGGLPVLLLLLRVWPLSFFAFGSSSPILTTIYDSIFRFFINLFPTAKPHSPQQNTDKVQSAEQASSIPPNTQTSCTEPIKRGSTFEIEAAGDWLRESVVASSVQTRLRRSDFTPAVRWLGRFSHSYQDPPKDGTNQGRC
jgi:hypothetical protein